MGSVMISQNFQDLLDPRIREVGLGLYDQGKSRIGDFFTEKTSDRPTETYTSMTPMGPMNRFLGLIPYDSPEQEYDVTSTHIEFAGGLQIARTLYDDDQFGVIEEMAGELGRSCFKTQENHAAGIFNGIFSATNDFFSHTEAVALCSNSHTTPVSGVSTATGFDNLATAELDPTSLTAAIIQFRQFKDASGDPLDLMPNKLLVPINLVDRANEIIKTSTGLDNADNNKNVHEGRFTIDDWFRVTDSNDWYLINTEAMKKSLLWFWKVKLELAKMENFDNIVAKWRAYMRYSYLRRDWRWVLGSQVS